MRMSRDDDEEAPAETALDYLSPFLPKISGTRGLSRDEALRVREECLKALRGRLIERANIIQVRASPRPARTHGSGRLCARAHHVAR